MHLSHLRWKKTLNIVALTILASSTQQHLLSESLPKNNKLPVRSEVDFVVSTYICKKKGF